MKASKPDDPGAKSAKAKPAKEDTVANSAKAKAKATKEDSAAKSAKAMHAKEDSAAKSDKAAKRKGNEKEAKLAQEDAGTTAPKAKTAKSLKPDSEAAMDGAACHPPSDFEQAKYFPCRAGIEWGRLQIHEVGKYSISKPGDSTDIAGTIARLLQSVTRGAIAPEDATIVDATACVGGDTLAFAALFRKVVAVERDPETYGMLVNNLHVYGVRNTVTINANAAELIKQHHQTLGTADVVYMDPPWNPPGQGLWHSKFRELMLYLDGAPVHEVVRELLRNPKHVLVVVKCPANFDVRRFMLALQDVPVAAHRVRGFLTLICVNPAAVS